MKIMSESHVPSSAPYRADMFLGYWRKLFNVLKTKRNLLYNKESVRTAQ